MRVSKRKWQGLFKVLVGCFSLAGPVKAETFVVTNLADQGEGSLRAAITEANTTNAPDLILFSDGSDGSLNFQDGLTRIIPVNSTLVVSAPLEIIGPGQDALVLDGGGDDDFLIETGETRIFSFTGSTNTNPHRIRALTIQNGSSLLGGANIRVLGSFEIFDCIVQGGRAAASAPNIFLEISHKEGHFIPKMATPPSVAAASSTTPPWGKSPRAEEWPSALTP